MKINFQKIATVLGSALLIGSTIGMAAAANYPAPFVQSGAADVAVVIGADAALSDAVAATNIGSNLATELAAQTAEGGSAIIGATSEGGDSVKLEKDTNLFNLGDEADTFYSTLDEDELTTVLAEGVYSNDENDEFDFEQKIEIGNQINLTHFQENDLLDDVPTIGFNLADKKHIMNYTLDFTDNAEAGGSWASGNDLETTDLTMLGRSYYILSARNTSAINHKLTLLDSANSAIVTEGEVSTITVGNTDYEISTEFIDSDEAILNVNGVSTNKLTEGGVYKIATDTYVAVKSILWNSKDTGISKVEVSIGSGKIELTNGAEMEINGDAVSTIEYDMVGTDEKVQSVVNAYITRSGNDIEQIVLEWKLDEKAWLSPGAELLFPGFETIKFSYQGFNVASEEVTTIRDDGSASVEISTVLEDGEVTFNFLSLNSSQSGFDSIGEDEDLVLLTNASINTITMNLNESEDSFFPVTWINGDDYESYLFQIKSITEGIATPYKNETILRNMADESLITMKELADTDSEGEVTFTLGATDEDLGTATVTLTRTSGSSGTLYADRLVTKAGLQFRLPVDNRTGDGSIFITNTTTAVANPAEWVMNFTEEDKDGEIGSGKSFTVTMVDDPDDGGEPSDSSLTEYETGDDTDLWEGYVVSDLATKVLLDKPTSGLNSIDITYHDTEAFADVFVSESQVRYLAGSTTSGSATELGSITAYDSEASSFAGKNLIVVGGSCINSVAAELLGEAACSEAFTTLTTVGAGEALIQSFDRNGKVALLVAGYNAADTTKAVTYLVNQGVDTTAGGDAMKVTSTTEATTIVA